MNYFYKNLSIWLIVSLIGLFLFNLFKRPPDPYHQVFYNTFLEQVEEGRLSKVKVKEDTITWVAADGTRYQTLVPADSRALERLLAKKVDIEVEKEVRPHWFFQTFLSWVPFLFLILAWFYFSGRGTGGAGGGKAMAFGKSRAQLIDSQQSKVTFDDVAGIDEAKNEVMEIVDFLKNPAKFTEAGARIPTGVLLYGEPGTGKTLLAKAIAGEAGVPFYSISGSNFVEMYVGIGASRVRDLFREGKKKAPCIIFIDEIDAVGRHRSAGGAGGGNDEREQTLNQLLVEMDGFEESDHVIVVAATNRQDILDPALLRPGRFDRQVLVPLPDVGGREKILKVHGRKIKASEDVDWKVIAQATPGFSGAQLANMINEAALLMARLDHDSVTMATLEEAKDKVMMGAERRSLILTQEEKRVTACHEAGHALVAWMLPGADPVHKVSIIPRGRALGITMQLPEVEKNSHSRTWLFNNLCTLLGGRLAEEIVMHEVTTGAGNDIERVSDLARKMVCEWGMSEALGPLAFSHADPLQGRPGHILSEETAVLIDQEVKKLVGAAYARAREILQEHRELLDAVTGALLEKETLSGDDLRLLVERYESGRN